MCVWLVCVCVCVCVCVGVYVCVKADQDKLIADFCNNYMYYLPESGPWLSVVSSGS